MHLQLEVAEETTHHLCRYPGRGRTLDGALEADLPIQKEEVPGAGREESGLQVRIAFEQPQSPSPMWPSKTQNGRHKHMLAGVVAKRVGQCNRQECRTVVGILITAIFVNA